MHHLQESVGLLKVDFYLPWETKRAEWAPGEDWGGWFGWENDLGSQPVWLNEGLLGFNQLGQKVRQILKEWNDQKALPTQDLNKFNSIKFLIGRHFISKQVSSKKAAENKF